MSEVDVFFVRNAPANPRHPGVSSRLKRKKEKRKKEKREKFTIFQASPESVRVQMHAIACRAPPCSLRELPRRGKRLFLTQKWPPEARNTPSLCLSHLDAKNAYAGHEKEKSHERVSVRGFFGNGLFRGREATPSSKSQSWGLPPPQGGFFPIW